MCNDPNCKRFSEAAPDQAHAEDCAISEVGGRHGCTCRLTTQPSAEPEYEECTVKDCALVTPHAHGLEKGVRVVAEPRVTPSAGGRCAYCDEELTSLSTPAHACPARAPSAGEEDPIEEAVMDAVRKAHRETTGYWAPELRGSGPLLPSGSPVGLGGSAGDGMSDLDRCLAIADALELTEADTTHANAIRRVVARVQELETQCHRAWQNAAVTRDILRQATQ